jgi:hypothetical protein
MPDTPKGAEKPASTADQLIRELRALIERRGWVPSGSGIDQEGGITVSARPKTDDE